MQKNSMGLSFLFIMLTMMIFAGGSQEEFEPLRGAEEGRRIEVVLEPGPCYSKKINKILYSYTVQPQVAIWLESLDGRYIETLYITRVVEKQEFRSAPDEGRPAALPVWSHISKSSADTVSSATTKEGNLTYGTSINNDLKPGRYVVKLETNRSYDWNDVYTKKNSGVNGQPSLIYKAELVLGEEKDQALFGVIGRGSVDGSNGEINPEIESMDKAFELFSNLQVLYFPE